jgi:PKD repeat protein
MVDVYDNTTGVPEEVMHQRIRFAAYDAYPTGAVDTGSVVMGLNHRYSITVTPSGPKGSWCTVDDRFPPPPPGAVITIVSVDYLKVVVDGSLSYDPDGTIVSYVWDFGDGSSATGMTATHTYAAEGTYTITLTVMNNDGLTSTDSELVTVHWPPLLASFTYTVDGLTVNVNASSSSSENGIVSYVWDWGDGTTGTGVTATHTYNTTESVATGSEPMSIGRADPSPPPPAVFGFTYAADGVTALPGCNVTVTIMRTGETIVWDETREIWDPNVNIYSVDMSEFQLIVPPATRPWVVGDILHVEVTKGSYSGFTDAPLTAMDNFEGYIQIDVTLDVVTVTVTLTVMDTIGQTDSVSQIVKLSASPVASFTYTVDGFTVNVDASGSSGSSGHDIVSYVWDWGDGTTGSGMVGTHTYAASVNSTPSQPSNGDPLHRIYGHIYAADGVTVLHGCDVTLVNLRTGYSLITTSDASMGYYLVDANSFEGGWFVGDPIRVTATSGSQTGWTTAPLTWHEIDVIDVAMGTGVVTITLKVTDTNGQTASVSHTVKLVLPPIASFTLTVDGLIVNVDASASSGQGGIVSYDWDWGDGTTGTGMVASHTYSSDKSAPADAMAYTGASRGPGPPFEVFGITYAPDGVTPLPNCTVTVTDLRTGYFVTTTSGYLPGQEGVYYVNWLQIDGGWIVGDVINVTAVNGALSGSAEGVSTQEWIWLDVTLTQIPGPIVRTITLTVTDATGQTSSVSKTVTLFL